jgi:DNA-binding MarR family transcriptional regulator
MTSTKTRIDPIIHAPNRLKICAMLTTVAEIEFKLLKEHLEISDSVLSKHLKALEEPCYIKLKKRSDLGRQRTWVSLTTKGREAFNIHIDALKEIVGNL